MKLQQFLRSFLRLQKHRLPVPGGTFCCRRCPPRSSHPSWKFPCSSAVTRHECPVHCAGIGPDSSGFSISCERGTIVRSVQLSQPLSEKSRECADFAALTACMLVRRVFLGGNVSPATPLECPHLRPGDGCLRRPPPRVGHPRIARRSAETSPSTAAASGDLAGDDGERKPGNQDEADEGERDAKREDRPGRAIRVAVEARSIVLPHGKTSRLCRGSSIALSAHPTVPRAARSGTRLNWSSQTRH